MNEHNGTRHYTDDTKFTEAQKNDFTYLKNNVDHYINTLVIAKPHIHTARNLYSGIRDSEEFNYLEEVFGISTPISVKMVSLVKPRIDILLGILLEETYTYALSVSDNESIGISEDAKVAEKVSAKMDFFLSELEGTLLDGTEDKEGNKTYSERVTKKLAAFDAEIDKGFMSGFDKAAGSLIKFLRLDTTINFKQKMKLFFMDVLMAGEGYYKIGVERVGLDPELTVIRPENFFSNKKTGEQFLSTGNKPNATAAVHIEYLSTSEVLSQWGHTLSDQDKEALSSRLSLSRANQQRVGVRVTGNAAVEGGQGTSGQHLHAVHHVEFLANNFIEVNEEDKDDYQTVESITHKDKDNVSEYDKKNRSGLGTVKNTAARLDRYEGIRIDSDVYINLGRSKNVSRSEGMPWSCTLSYNGFEYGARGGNPYSAALALKDCQDMSDIVRFFRDNIIANAGVSGSIINMAAIPKALGDTFTERLMAFQFYKKQGMELYDPTEPGAELFQQYGTYASSLDGASLQQLEMVLEGIQREADVLSGINRFMYQATEVRDAVSNVKMGQRNVSLMTKDLFSLMTQVQEHTIGDFINAAKISYKKGKRGYYILGDSQVYFDIRAEDFCYTDFNVYVTDSTEDKKKLLRITEAVPQLIQSNLIESDVLVKIIMEDSPKAIIDMVEGSATAQRLLNDTTSQLQQQVDQSIQQSEATAEEITKLTNKINQLEQQRDDFKSKEIEVKMRMLDIKEKHYNDRKETDDNKLAADVEKTDKLLELEEQQMEEGSGKAAEIRNELQ